MEELQLMFLGGLQIAYRGDAVTGFVSRKVQALLCYLAVTGQSHLRPSLAGLLWGDMPEDKANANLRKALSNLRHLVGDYVAFSGNTVAFVQSSPYRLDVAAFKRQAEPALLSGNHSLDAETAAGLARAANLYGGDFLAGFHIRGAYAFEEWAVVQRERLRDLALQTLRALVNYHTARGENDQALRHASRLLAMEPWNEEGHRSVMLLLARDGQRGAALAQYEACRRVLLEEFGVAPMAETTGLYERLRTAPARTPRLPLQPTPFVGREADLAQIAHSFDDPSCRLLTLVGAGGIGKTRLALEYAARRRTAFLDGVYFVPLDGIDSPDLLVPSIATALAFSFFGRQDPRTQLLNYLSEKELLLVLDGVEHLLDGAGLISNILEAAPAVKILVASRERLNLRWEWIHDVPGLACPDDDEVDGLDRYAAVQLFARLASRICSGFSLAEDGQCVARICRLVGGMPLALELAAAAVRARSCRETAAAIENNVDLLATSARDVPARHRSVRAAFEGSWRTLSGDERVMCRRLSVFRGGFPPEAAGSIAGASLPVLRALVSKSFLRETGDGRYAMHELVRQYAGEHMASCPAEVEEVRARHAAHYAAFLQDRECALRDEKQRAVLREIDAEIENVRAAWRQAVDHVRVDVIDAALQALYRFYDLRGWVEEAHDALSLALAALPGGSPEMALLRGRVLARQAWFTFRLGRYKVAQSLAEASLTEVRRARHPEEEAFALAILGRVAEEQGDYALAGDHYDQARALYEEGGDPWHVAQVLNQLGNLSRTLGNYDRALAYYRRCLALYQETGDPDGIAEAYNSLGSAAGIRGDYEEAQAYFERSLTICRGIDDRFGIASACHNLSNLAYLAGEYATAKELRQEVLAICREIGFAWGVADTLRHLGDAHRRVGEHEEARRLYEESLIMKERVGDRRGLALVYNSLGDLLLEVDGPQGAGPYYRQALDIAHEIRVPPVLLAVLCGRAACLVGESQAESALELLSFIRHHPACEQQLIDAAAPLESEARSQLAPMVAAVAEERGRARTLEGTIAWVLAGWEPSEGSLGVY